MKTIGYLDLVEGNTILKYFKIVPEMTKEIK